MHIISSDLRAPGSSVTSRVYFLLATLTVAILPAFAYGQNCKRLEPAGPGLDDSARINECLATKGRAKLKAGTFLLYSPIFFPRKKKDNEVSSVKLEGKGMDQTRLVVQADCRNHWPFVTDESPGQYQSVVYVVKSPAASVRNLEIDVSDLRRDCGYLGNVQVNVNDSPGAEITGIRVKGSKYGSPQYTTGGANGGGIIVLNSEASTVTDNEVTDIGFMFENGGASAGYAGISLQNSGNSIVQNNRITRVAFGITVVNGTPELGYNGNASGSRITANTIVGAANINCPDCSQGRAIKLQACGLGTELPLENLIVSDNIATEFGGTNGALGGSGLDLLCGVRYSRFENNKFIGASTAEFGLAIRSSFLSPVNPTHHNEFSFNTFISGRPLGCGDHCSDVIFTPDGPDQIGIRRKGADRTGTNEVINFRFNTDRDCNDYSHAFYLYTTDNNFARQGEDLLLTAVGVRPNSTVTFRFKREEDESEMATYTSRRANNNCIMNQELMRVDAAQFAPGYYKIFAEYQDGNTNNVFISNDLIGTIRVKPAKSD